jgi:hypothetical protein
VGIVTRERGFDPDAVDALRFDVSGSFSKPLMTRLAPRRLRVLGICPETKLSYNPKEVTTPNYGITQHQQLFTDRQRVAMTTFTDLVSEARAKIVLDAAGHEYADAVTTYLGLSIGRLANRCSSHA